MISNRENRVINRILSLMLITLIVCALIIPVGTEEAYGDNKGLSRVSGSNRFETSLKVTQLLKKEKGVSKYENIIIASGKTFPDALSGSYLAKAADAPVLLVDQVRIPSVVDYVKKNLKTGGTVYILGGAKAVSKSVETNLKSIGVENVTRLGGVDRYETNTQIVAEADRLLTEKTGKVPNHVIVCSGQNFPDALSAGATGLPIILVKHKFSGEQKQLISERAKSGYTIIGGEKAISINAENDLKNYGKVSRISGNNRYDTSVKVATRFFGTNPKEVIVVNGENFPDGLSAAPLAQQRNCPIILTDTNNFAQGYNYCIKANNTKATLVGGPKVVTVHTIATTQSRYRRGFIRYNSESFIFVRDDQTIATKTISAYGMALHVYAGGLISPAQTKELARRMKSVEIVEDESNSGTGILITISDQKLDYIENGQFKFTTDIVSGTVSRGHDTPTGVYYVANKATDIVMRGYYPNGELEYESPADYWMGFIGHEYGIHDSYWRTEFGGDIYQYNGSHGCVNIPKWNMPALFDMVSLYTLVIIVD